MGREFRIGTGNLTVVTPPPGGGQTENTTFHHPSDAGCNQQFGSLSVFPQSQLKTRIQFRTDDIASGNLQSGSLSVFPQSQYKYLGSMSVK